MVGSGAFGYQSRPLNKFFTWSISGLRSRLGLFALVLLTQLATGSYAWAQDAPADNAVGPEKTFLQWLIDSSGIFGGILALLSFIMVAVIVANWLQLRRSALLPPDFLELFEERLNAGDVRGAYEVSKADDSFIARVLGAGLARLNRGYSEAIEGMQEIGEEETMAMENKLSYLSLISSVAPMIGLMGTVYGMILSFQKIANNETAPKPKELAEGISTALFTTLEGLIVAVPAMIAFTLLRNRMSRLVLEVGNVAENLMARFSAAGKSARTAKPAKSEGDANA